MLHLSPDLFIGFGPELSYDFAGAADGANLTQLALALELGGVVGSGAVTTLNDSARGRPGFGRAGSMVLTSELTLSGTLRWHAGLDVSTRSLSISPELDWFVIDNLSVGGALPIDIARSSVFDGEAPNVQKTFAIGFEPRVGYNLPFNEWLSLYARAGVLFQRGSYHIDSAEVPFHDSSYSRTALVLSLRMIAQVSEHLFLGLGPSLDHVLSRTSRGDDMLVRPDAVTTLGLTSTFGGWFDLQPSSRSS